LRTSPNKTLRAFERAGQKDLYSFWPVFFGQGGGRANISMVKGQPKEGTDGDQSEKNRAKKNAVFLAWGDRPKNFTNTSAMVIYTRTVTFRTMRPATIH
jgi:hypothetical protein